MSERRALIIDDEEGIRTSLGLILADEGYRVTTASGPEEAVRAVADAAFEVVLCDVRMPQRSGLDLLPDLVRAQPEATILMMSAYGDVDQAIEAVRRGAYDYLQKPFQIDELLLTIRKAEERERLRRENKCLRQELRRGLGSQALVAASDAMKQVFELVESAAEYKTTVLITGESGVGKELVARTVHEMSSRSSRLFVPLNCGAIPETLIESELFGHARGAFTGANAEKRGLFREADGGTLFLDEIGELPASVQVKLLRVLQEEEVRPVGDPKPVRVDVRILAATARDLEAEVEAGRFRADLFYRLNVFRIHVPPLRDRPDDIPILADHLLLSLQQRIGKSVRTMDTDVVAALRRYSWPGNVRELANTLERATILAPGDRITLDLLPFPREPESSGPAENTDTSGDDDQDLSIKRRTRRLEAALIRRGLELTSGNRTRAAKILDISSRALQYKIKAYGIEPLNPASDPTDSD